jgi:glycosyltransferase involved in cell wall biosynthesis
MPEKKILMVSWYFPPNPSVGGRRWAKFAKYLHRKGHQVTVITAEKAKGETSPWDTDVADLEIHRLPRKYPQALEVEPSSIIEKVKYRLAVSKLKKSTKGTIYDRTIHWEEQFLELAEQLIADKQIDTIIANGPPFRIVYYCTQLKQKYPEIQLVSDFRDPWTWWYNLGYPYLTPENKAFEAEMEKAVVQFSDHTLVPIVPMQQLLQDKYPEQKEKITVLPHAYDADEMYSGEKADKVSNEQLKFIYFGTIYDGQEEAFQEFANVLKSNPNKATVDFYSSKFSYQNIFEQNELSEVKYHQPVPAKDLFARLGGFDFVIIFYPEIFKDYFATKFYEIIYSRVPFLLICEEGEMSQFITKHQLGIHFTPANFTTGMTDLLNGNVQFNYNFEFDIEAYSFDHQTDQLLQLMDRS